MPSIEIAVRARPAGADSRCSRSQTSAVLAGAAARSAISTRTHLAAYAAGPRRRPRARPARRARRRRPARRRARASGTRRRGRCRRSRTSRGRSPRLRRSPRNPTESTSGPNAGAAHWPVRPSMHSRSRSACPPCRAYSSIMCTTRSRTLTVLAVGHRELPARGRPRERVEPGVGRGDLAPATTAHASSTTAGSATAPLKSSSRSSALGTSRARPGGPATTRWNQCAPPSPGAGPGPAATSTTAARLRAPAARRPARRTSARG